MRVIGILGITPKVTMKYYCEFNDLAASANFGHNASADLLINSIDLQEFIDSENKSEDKKEVIKLLIENITKLEKGGAEFIVLASNYPHVYYDEIIKHIKTPIIHIADAVVTALAENNYKKVALVGSKSTLNNKFYVDRLSNKNIETLLPDEEDIKFLDKIIFEELILGIHNVDSRKKMLSIIDSLANKGAEAVVLGSTEYTYFLTQDLLKIPMFDSTLLHTKHAFSFAAK